MDPNAALDVLRRALNDYHSPEDNHPESAWNALEAIAEQAEALDIWLSRGGFLPDAWTR